MVHCSGLLDGNVPNKHLPEAVLFGPFGGEGERRNMQLEERNGVCLTFSKQFKRDLKGPW